MGTSFQGTQTEIEVLNAWIKLTRAQETVHKIGFDIVRAYGLTVPQFGVLEIVLHLGPQCQKSLGEKLLWSGGNVTRVIDNLVKNGWIVRKVDDKDRRYFYIHLTESGRKLIVKVFREHLDRLVSAFSCLTSEEKVQLADLSKKLGTCNCRRN